MKIIQEGKAKINISPAKKISKQMEVFYNPVMKLNRDISVVLLNSIKDKQMQIALPLVGTGIRGIRFFQELKKDKIRLLAMNDYSENAVKLIKKNLILNKIDSRLIELHNQDANRFLLESTGFDYIDIDPFGTPNPFLDSAVKRISRDGILAVTATDTGALAGSYTNACKRKYWARPLKNELMHETGLRILIRKVQLIGAEYEKALVPMFSYSHEHYMRVFFRCDKGRKKVDKLLKEHKFLLYNPKTMGREVSEHNLKKGYDYAGPLWVGKLWDSKLVDKMSKNCDKENKKLFNLLSIIKEESKIDVIGFYDLHKIAKKTKGNIPKIESILKKGKVARTHFVGWGVRSKKMPKF